MTVGVVMLVHQAVGRAAQVARHLASQACPVVLHVDRRVGRKEHAALVEALSDLNGIRFSERLRCEWGTWALVAATQKASEMLLAEFSEVQHVYLASGSCLPLRPVRELEDYLNRHPGTDFIESVTTDEVHWTIGGLDAERFTLSFPFSWKRHRRLFDRYVRLQRRLGFSRTLPDKLVPHMGSQWWCLTRQTLSAILESPQRPVHDAYFSKVWIPDESYFQTLARHYSSRIESRSLTLSKFDFQGKPHTFYDDHLQLLRRSDCFVARKIWPRADKLYQTFLDGPGVAAAGKEPNPGKIDKIFAKALETRTKGRPGLYMQSRFPRDGFENGKTSGAYSVFEGFAEIFDGFESWLSKIADVCVHGHLFAPERAEFAENQPIFSGALSDSAALRDYNPNAFLTSLIWNTRGERQCFQFGPRDTQGVSWLMATDPNAQISVISGAWAVPLFRSNEDFSILRKEAARLQKIESSHLEILRSQYTKARVRIWKMAEFVEAPMDPLQTIVGEIGLRRMRQLAEVPKMVDLHGFGQFLRKLKNEGMQPYLMGDFPAQNNDPQPSKDRRRPYLVR